MNSGVFAELGLEVSIEVVAERAGVGLGTIYRRFANKQALIAELVNRLLTDVVAIGERHLDDPGGSGLVNYMHEVCQLLAGNRGAVARLWNDPSSQALVSRSRDVQQRLVEAAKAAGTVRDDLAGEDLAVALWSIHGILDVTKGTDIDAWSRHLYFILQGFAAPGSAPAALSPAAMTMLAIALLAAWLVAERRSRHPLIDMAMMSRRGVWTANLVAMLAGASMYAAYAFIPQFTETSPALGYGFGASVTEAGLLLLPASVATLVVGLVNSRLTARFGDKAVVVSGSLLTALSMLLLFAAHGSRAEVAAGTAVMGFGVGVAFGSLSSLIVRAVPAQQTGVASGMNANIRTIGGSIGTALFAAVLTASTTGRAPSVHGYEVGFLMLAVLGLLGAGGGLLVPAHPKATARDHPTVLADTHSQVQLCKENLR